MTNEVRLSGTLTKEPYKSPKGWMNAMLAVGKSGTDYKIWVNLYIPSGVAAAFDGAQRNEAFEISGELDESKDQQGNKRLQVKVARAKKAAPPATKHTPVDNGFITDDDLPDF